VVGAGEIGVLIGAGDESAAEGIEGDGEGIVVVGVRRQGGPDFDPHPQFLAQFADQGRGRGLAILDLPARELPLAGHAQARFPAGGKDQAVAFDDGADNVEVAGHGLKSLAELETEVARTRSGVRKLCLPVRIAEARFGGEERKQRAFALPTASVRPVVLHPRPCDDKKYPCAFRALG
jgi:hypothetical protein